MEKIKLELVSLLTKEVGEIFDVLKLRNLQTSTKSDKSIVTEIDLLVSEYIKVNLSQHDVYKNYNFYSEEDFTTLSFPAAILDPIDGTREFSVGRAECAVSLALMASNEILDPSNYAWLYNPFSGFSLDSNQTFVKELNVSSKNITGMVSRSENYLGLFNIIENKKIQIIPRGSIAFKLGLLSSGAIDFVISKNPKNIWDIAAGTILVGQRGFNFYVNGKKITHFKEEKIEGVMIWARESQIEELLVEFQK